MVASRNHAVFCQTAGMAVFRHCYDLPVIGRNFSGHFLTTKQQLKTTNVLVAA